MFYNAPIWLVKLLDAGRNDRIKASVTLPTGELVILSEKTLKHVKDSGRGITERQILKTLQSPVCIHQEGRPLKRARDKFVVSRYYMEPTGKAKIKRLIVHVKRCRKLLVFRVAYVSTALISAKLPPDCKMIWGKEE